MLRLYCTICNIILTTFSAIKSRTTSIRLLPLLCYCTLLTALKILTGFQKVDSTSVNLLHSSYSCGCCWLLRRLYTCDSSRRLIISLDVFFPRSLEGSTAGVSSSQLYWLFSSKIFFCLFFLMISKRLLLIRSRGHS